MMTGFERYTRKMRRALFLEEMEQMVPWTPPSKRHRVCQSGKCKTNHYEWRGAFKMKVTTIGMDLAKHVIQVHGLDQYKQSCTPSGPVSMGMEACGSAHAWARRLMKLGYTVKLMVPQFVKPYALSARATNMIASSP
jgi:hypothetical protein